LRQLAYESIAWQLCKVIKKLMLPIKLVGIDHSKGLEALKANLISALKSVGMKARITEVTDVDEIIGLDIYGIPALLIDGVVAFQKEVPSRDDICRVLESHLGSGTSEVA
jgi:hypothetical protein